MLRWCNQMKPIRLNNFSSSNQYPMRIAVANLQGTGQWRELVIITLYLYMYICSLFSVCLFLALVHNTFRGGLDHYFFPLSFAPAHRFDQETLTDVSWAGANVSHSDSGNSCKCLKLQVRMQTFCVQCSNMLWVSSEQYLHPPPDKYVQVAVQVHQVIAIYTQHVGAVYIILCSTCIDCSKTAVVFVTCTDKNSNCRS